MYRYKPHNEEVTSEIMKKDKYGQWVQYDEAQMVINQLTNAIDELQFNKEHALTALQGENKIINNFFQ